MHLLVPKAADEGGFVGPSIAEFFPDIVLFEGTPFAMNRIMMIRIIVVLALVLLFWLGTRRMSIVPGRFQTLIEMALNLVRVNIAEDVLGKKDGTRFLPLLTTIFFLVLGMNLTGVVPFFNVAGTAVIGLPLVLAAIAYIAFIYAGLRKHPGAFLKNSLFPPGVPKPIYIIVTPIEFVSIFVLRPVTLCLRLLLQPVGGRRVPALRCRHPRLRLRLHPLRGAGGRAAGVRLHPADHGLHPAGAG
jgi:F-type H+-transporting ATPase subunit a